VPLQRRRLQAFGVVVVVVDDLGQRQVLQARHPRDGHRFAQMLLQ
jgi:hypothetical protein